VVKRIQLSRKKGHHKPASAVNVARPTKWGNPFNWQQIIGYENPKEIACQRYESWLNGDYEGYEPEKRQWILDHIHELTGKDLCCWCKPSDHCHADVLIRLSNNCVT